MQKPLHTFFPYYLWFRWYQSTPSIASISPLLPLESTTFSDNYSGPEASQTFYATVLANVIQGLDVLFEMSHQ